MSNDAAADQIIYADNGAFGGEAIVTLDKATNVLTVQTELGRLAERYHAALTDIAGMMIPNFPAPPGDTFGPKVKLAVVQAMRDVAREALKG